MQWAAWTVGLAILGLAGAGALRMVREQRDVAELFAMVGAASLVLLTSWGNQRFRLVAEPELAVLAAVTLVHLWSRRRARDDELAPGPMREPSRAVEPTA